MIYSVYTIRDRFEHVRYVGCTGKLVIDRLKQHKNQGSDVGRWIQSEVNAGHPVTIVSEEEFDSACHSFGEAGARRESMSAEKAYIKGYRNLVGDRLFNRTGKHHPLLRTLNAYEQRTKRRSNPFADAAKAAT